MSIRQSARGADWLHAEQVALDALARDLERRRRALTAARRRGPITSALRRETLAIASGWVKVGRRARRLERLRASVRLAAGSIDEGSTRGSTNG